MSDSEKDVFKVTLPLPPSVNKSLRPTSLGRHGSMRLVHTRKSKAWAAVAALVLKMAKKPKALLQGPVAVRLVVYVPSIASDGPNRQKALEDALVRAGVLSDDRQIAEWSGIKRVVKTEGHVEVEIRQADPDMHQELAKRLATAEAKKGKRHGQG